MWRAAGIDRAVAVAVCCAAWYAVRARAALVWVHQGGPTGPNAPVWEGHEQVAWPGARSFGAVTAQPASAGGGGAAWLFGGSAYLASRGSGGGAVAADELWTLGVAASGVSWALQLGGRGGGRAAHGQRGARGVPSARHWPGARSGHAIWAGGAATAADGGLLLFGGMGYGADSRATGVRGRLNDLWVWRPSVGHGTAGGGGSWAWWGGHDGVDSRGAYGTLGVASRDAWPGARDGHSVVPVLAGGTTSACHTAPQPRRDHTPTHRAHPSPRRELSLGLRARAQVATAERCYFSAARGTGRPARRRRRGRWPICGSTTPPPPAPAPARGEGGSGRTSAARRSRRPPPATRLGLGGPGRGPITPRGRRGREACAYSAAAATRGPLGRHAGC
jgi:hypothetical protein